MLSAFGDRLGLYPVGSLVCLASGRLAVVIEQNRAALTTPAVKVFFSTKSNTPVPVERLDLAGSADRITGRAPLERGNFPQLDALWSEDALPRR